MLETQKSIALDQEIQLHNPDPPYGEYRYQFHIRAGSPAFEELTQRLRRYRPDAFILVTDEGVPQTYREQVKACLLSIAPCSEHLVRGGEQEKRLSTVERIGNAAIGHGASKASIILALGGGLVGNIAGLLALLFFRGSRLVHLPTTFLAISDSCLSLKQGVNGDFGKNHFGQYYPPLFVWADLAVLQTLPNAEMRSALNEVIKNVLIVRPGYYRDLLATLRLDACYTEQQLVDLLLFCIDAKCALMGYDAHEKHDAVLLEFGHTIGHPIELRSARLGIPRPHGEAIGTGMWVEALIAYRLGLLGKHDLQACADLLQANGTPLSIPSALSSDDLIALMYRDNKRGAYLPPIPGMIDMVLLRSLGVPNRTEGTVLTRVEEGLVRRVLDECRA